MTKICVNTIFAKLITAILLFSEHSHSGEWIYDPDPTDNIEIANPQMDYSAGIYFQNPTGFSNPYGCENNKFISIVDSEMAKQALSLALYAKTTNQRVRFYVTGCNGQYLKADSISITK